MMKLWNQEAAQWRLELSMDGEALSLRMFRMGQRHWR